ncbi:putative Calnexin like protein [Blattamonas nauphoetae]|uniref:Calnexin like protein n=1 Tax=Blattamonas nauphoetae TaxID=2049346 RepID=A0ABQ9XHU3_9EUKA|nr:putative Calnexin like protein [Blattamonas nauphoetae]
MFSLILLASLLQCEIFFKEDFSGDWQQRWIQSDVKQGNDRGEFAIEPPKKTPNKETNKGLKTKKDGAFYQISADIGKTLNFVNKTFIFSYTIKNEQELRCGGTYIKLLSEKAKQAEFGSDSPFKLMFGPDICGSEKDRMQFILRKHKKEYHSGTPPKCKNDHRTHLYTLIMRPDVTYEIHIDGKTEIKSKLYQDFPGIYPRPTIADPTVEKPADWSEQKMIPDPNVTKPADWDQPMTIPDTNAVKPKDWDEATNGPWIQPRKPNPKYKATWHPPLVENPNYQGKWKAPQVPNPAYEEKKNSLGLKGIRYVGIDVMQKESGTIFNNFFIGDNMTEYKEFVKQRWDPVRRYEERNSSSGSKSESQKSNNNIHIDNSDDDDNVDL